MTEQELTEQVTALYLGGESVNTVATKLGITYGRVRRIMLSAEVPLRDPSTRLMGKTRPDTKNKETK